MLTEYLNDVISVKRGELIGFTLILLSIYIIILLLEASGKNSKQSKNIVLNAIVFLIAFALMHIIYYFCYL